MKPRYMALLVAALALPLVYWLRRETFARVEDENIRYDLDRYLTSLGL